MRRYRVNNVCVQYQGRLSIGMDSRHDIAQAQVILLPSFFLVQYSPPCTQATHHITFLQSTRRPVLFALGPWPSRIEKSSSCRHLPPSRDATHSAPSSLHIQPLSQSAASIPLQRVCESSRHPDQDVPSPGPSNLAKFLRLHLLTDHRCRPSATTIQMGSSSCSPMNAGFLAHYCIGDASKGMRIGLGMVACTECLLFVVEMLF